jgi:hypothetical protein
MKTIREGSERQCSWERPPRCWHLQPWGNGTESNSNSNQWPYGNPWPYANGPTQPSGGSPVLAVVGDIACQPGETEPTGESSNENCTTPKAPYTSHLSVAIPGGHCESD